MRFSTKTLLYLSLITISIFSYVMYFQYHNSIGKIVLSEQKLASVTYKTVIDTYKKNTDMLFTSLVDKSDIKELLYKASLTNDQEKLNNYRKILKDKLLDTYTRLKNYDIKQFQFHLKDNVSFLRLHKPEKYGDNLSNIRSTVVYVNKYHKKISGFELGKVNGGFRFVFPLSYENRHIGSVEISISIKAILDVNKENRKSKIGFIVNKKAINQKVFDSEHKAYRVSDITPEYLYEITNLTDDIKAIEVAFSAYKKRDKTYQEKLQEGKTFSFISTYKGVYSVTTFLPVANATTGKTVAYLIETKPNSSIAESKEDFILAWLIGVLVLIYSFIGVYKIKKAEQLAQESVEIKSLFLANMSHEIRTPMNAIIGFTNLLQKTNLDKEQQKNLGFIKASATSLLNIINDILDFSKIEAGKLELEHIVFNMKETCSHIYEMFTILTLEKNITLQFDYKSKYQGNVLGDPTRVEEIIINIVNNAIKFTKEGYVHISIETLSEDDKEIRYEINVQDTGIGISQENIKNLFTSFTQEDVSTNRQFGGTGLGLSITKTLSEMMDGDVKVKSTVGEGSTFSVNIKLEKTEEEVKTKNAENILNTDLSSLKVLVAEDNKTNQVLIDIILDELGIEATIVNDGQEAVEILKTTKFDLVLMDIQMPNLDGYSATKIIRDVNSGVLDNNITIIALSANAMKSDIEKSLASGMNNHLEKPIDTEKLYEVLQESFLKSRE